MIKEISICTIILIWSIYLLVIIVRSTPCLPKRLLHYTTLINTSFPLNCTLFHFTFLPFGFTPFKFSTTSLRFTSLHFTALLRDFRLLLSSLHSVYNCFPNSLSNVGRFLTLLQVVVSRFFGSVYKGVNGKVFPLQAWAGHWRSGG
jgi:hypothetical protein